MRPTTTKLRISGIAQQIPLFALIAISTSGCSAVRSWQTNFSMSRPTNQITTLASDPDSQAEQRATAEIPGKISIQPVTFRGAVVQDKPLIDVTEQRRPSDATLDANNGELPIPVTIPVTIPETTTKIPDLPEATPDFETISDPPNANAPQTVDQFVQIALANHPSIRAARQRVSAELNRMPQVRALPDPKFTNTFWPLHDQSLQTAAGRVGNQMSLSQAIPWPEKLQTKAAIVSQEVRVAQAEVEEIEREIIESVQLAYYEVWYATRATTIIAETRKLIADLTKVAETRYRSGGSQQDVLRAQLEADRLDEQLVNLRKQKRFAQADLAALVQQPATMLAETTDDLGLRDIPNQLDELIALAERCNPKLKGLAWEIQRDRQKHHLACLEKYPDLQVGMNWGLVNDNTRVLSPVADGQDQLNFNVGTTLPIWRDKINAGVREAANRTSSTVKRLDAERNALHGELRRLLVQADALTEQRDIYQNRIIPRTEATLKLSVADYRGKRTDFFSLIETYRELLIHETQLARIDASIAGTLARIERAVGSPTH
ncbi:TolC family protein [Rubripirellula sp.]|nr:TolC family protein [Rubripirellula sp.]